MPCGLSCYGTRGNSPACELVGGGSVSIKERVTLVTCGQLAIVSQSARSAVKTSSIVLFSNCSTQGLHRRSPCICAQSQSCKSTIFSITDW